MSLTQRVARGFRAMLFAQVVQVTTKGLLVLLLTRVFLDPDQYGLAFLAISILSFLLFFSNLGFAKSGARYIAEYQETDPGQIPFILRTAFRYTVLSILAVCGFILLARTYIADVLGEPQLALLLLIGTGYVAASTLFTFFQLSFQGFNRVEWTATIEALSGSGRILSVVGLLLLGLGVQGVIYGYVVGSAIAVLVGALIMYRRFYTQYERDTPEQGLKRRILRYSVPLAATRGANKLDKQVDTVLVGYFRDPVAVGFYTLGKQIADFVIAPATSLGFTVSPTMGEQKANDKLNEAASVYERTFTYVVALYVPAAVGLALVADSAVPLIFGTEYSGAVPVIQIFGLFVLLRAIDKVTNDVLDFLGRARDRAVIKGGISVGNFLLNLILIPLFGVVGAATATVTTYSILVGAEVYIIHDELDISLSRLLGQIAHVGTISLVMAGVVMPLLPHVSGLLSLTFVIATGGVVWAALAEFSGLLDLRWMAAQLT